MDLHVGQTLFRHYKGNVYTFLADAENIPLEDWGKVVSISEVDALLTESEAPVRVKLTVDGRAYFSAYLKPSVYGIIPFVLYGREGNLYLRPYAMFHDHTVKDGVTFKRFTRLD